jgi:ketosteroid isomerase-like protein
MRILVLSIMLFAGQVLAGDPKDELFAIERESHQQWLRSDLAALDALMADSFRFVAMNGAVESKAMVIGNDPAVPQAPRPLRIESLVVEPDELHTHGDTAVVISTMRIDGTVRGRPLPPEMRVLSVFQRDGSGGWKLIARSITPRLAPPPQ